MINIKMIVVKNMTLRLCGYVKYKCFIDNTYMAIAVEITH